MSRYEIEVKIEAQNRASREFKELERDISRVKQESRGAAQQSDMLGNALNNLNKAAGAVGISLGAMELAKTAVQMAQAGEQVVNTSNRFRDLTGGTTQAAAALEQLRQVSRGMVTDTELMAGASRLLQMGIAGSVDEAAQLVEIAIALKQPTDSAGDAISNLALMIANLSYERLDALGLSAGYVRQRVAELKDAGMDMQEAFATAVIEQAADSMDRLAESTEQAETNISKLTVKLGNMRDVANQAAFAIGEVVAGAAQFDVSGLLLAGVMEISGANQRLAQEEFDTYLNDLRDYIQSREDAIIIGTQNFREAEAAAERRNTQEITEARQQLNSDLTALEAEAENERLQNFLRTRERLAFYEQSYLAQGLRQTEAASAYRQQIAEREANAIMATLDMLDASFEQVYEQGVRRDGFYDVRNLSALSAEAENFAQIMEYAGRALDLGHITDQQYNSIKRVADEADRMFDNAQRGVEALRNASLSQLLGEAGPTAATEIGMQVSVHLVDEDLNEEFQKALERLTGQRNTLTDYMEEQLVPLVAMVTEAIGPEEGARFAENLHNEIMQGIDDGLSPEQIKQRIQERLGYGFNFDEPITVTVPAMVTWTDILSQGTPNLVDPETGEPLEGNDLVKAIEEQLGLEEGTIDGPQALKYSLANTEVTIEDIARVTGAAQDQLIELAFNDPNNPSVDVTEPLSINLHSVGWGQILDTTGLTTAALLAQLPEEAVSIINGLPFIRPGTYQVAPLAPTQPAPLGPFTPSVPSLGYGMPTGTPSTPSADPVSQMALNAMTMLGQAQVSTSAMNTDLISISSTAAAMDFSTMYHGMEMVSNITQGSIDNLQTLTDTEWVATVALDFVILDGTKWGQLPGFVNAVQSIMERSTRDNGGVPVGTNQVNGR